MVTLTIEQDATTEDLYIQIPHHIRQELNWQEGDTLIWEIQSDNTINVRKECSVSEYKAWIIKDYLKQNDKEAYYDWIYQG